MSLKLGNRISLDINQNRFLTQYSILKKLNERFNVSDEEYVRDFAELFSYLWDEKKLKWLEIMKIFILKCWVKENIELNKTKVYELLSH